MDIQFMVPLFIQNQVAATEILNCNKLTQQFGLLLTPPQAQQLVETRSLSLQSNGRIEFGGGIINKLIFEFCDSPYICQNNYAQTLHELIEIFYYFKNETLDTISDDELIGQMKKYFDTYCNGSIELLQGRELEILSHPIRFHIQEDDTLEEESNYLEEEDDE